MGLLLLLTLALRNLATNVYAVTLRLQSLEEKVRRSNAILQVTLIEALPTRVTPNINPLSPHTNNLVSPIVCKARVNQVLKGPTNLIDVEFRSVPLRNGFTGKHMEDLIGKECFVFLEERPIGAPPPQLWMLQPPRLLAHEYTEYRFDNRRQVTERYSHSNYVARIRALATQY